MHQKLFFSPLWPHQPFVSSLSHVYRLKNLEELPKIIKLQLNKEVNIEEFVAFLGILDENTFDYHVSQFNTAENPFLGDLLSNSKIHNKQMQNYLENFHKEFEDLAMEHIKKIKLHKRYLH